MLLTDIAPSLTTKHLGLADYESTWRAMQVFTARRSVDTNDEIWLLQHPPVYTQGLAGRPEHLLTTPSIAVVKTDRGGQITYHGPGQIIAYVLFDLKRKGIGVKELVRRIEQSIIDLLRDYGVDAERKPGAPGVYVKGAKIAALGLRVKNGCSYHGLALNVAMDLTPYSAINPCGYAGLKVTDLATLGVRASIDDVMAALSSHLITQLSL
ncbi:MAG: lipoyl(octanoyl) transferase LipB [Burkholderiales bacterium]